MEKHRNERSSTRRRSRTGKRLVATQTHWLRNCGLHLQKKTMQLDATIANGIGYVQVDTSKKYQTIEGFGALLHEARQDRDAATRSRKEARH